MVETSTKTIPHPVPGSGLYYSEDVAGSEKAAAPSIPREKNSGVSFQDAKPTREFNIAVIGGPSGIGKTALVERFVYDTYIERYDMTIEEDLHHRQILVADEVSLLNISDTAGLEEYKILLEFSMKEVDGVVLAFRRVSYPSLRSLVMFPGPNSLTDKYSLEEFETFRDKIYHIKGSRSVPIVAVGLKSDLSYEREVDAATIESLSTRLNIPFYEASAKLNWHVENVFEDLVRQLRLKYSSHPVVKRGKQQQGSCIIM
ncbi:P-loop containing nucleoside triphosphate hydrolase protein [Mycena pura]|uniref:P-loop containing nucleoside triphosphate hydrolase protein n=1 Tax=Mycena pura TaxID=153505 RepID=A0AAD6YCC2_9AGAR|nr:P-loop containing nucleoside triphosphate hydrolase protein [Mycena pura]